MVTKNQFLFHSSKNLKSFSFSRKLEKNPQKKGFCKKIFTLAPKKPNSALRKVVQCILSNNFKAIIHIPGIGHNLQKHGHILIYGFRLTINYLNIH